MKSPKRLIAILLAFATVSVGGVAVAAPASAAVAYCNSVNLSDTFVRPAFNSSNNNCYMHQYKQSGSGVTRLQHALWFCYGQDIEFDGVFGPATAAALANAQRAEGITADGKYGPQTRNALRWNNFNGNVSYCAP
jgi:peptidoglycan hydrolase-like protein with peptidoglycan-binding domain